MFLRARAEQDFSKAQEQIKKHAAILNGFCFSNQTVILQI
jgi:hypothetical protein